MVDSGKVPHAIMLHENNGGGGFSLPAFLQYLYYSSRSDGDSAGYARIAIKFLNSFILTLALRFL